MMLKLGFFVLSLLCASDLYRAIPVKHDADWLKSCIADKTCSKLDTEGNPVNLDKPNLKYLCGFCDVSIPIVKELVIKNDTGKLLEVATFFCKELKITDETVCHQAVELFQSSVVSVIRDTKLSNKEICAAALGCSTVRNPAWSWNVTLPNVPKPPVLPPNPPSSGSPTLRILQLTDIHIDFEYQPGALADCSQPLCCRNSSTNKSGRNGSHPRAGYWGDYRHCDSPLWTVENMFEHISQNEQFDFIYWTGDLPPHNVWNQSKSDQLGALDKLTSLFLKYFPDKVIYPGLGNHEATPCNLFPPPFVKEDNITWLYAALARDWTKTGLPSYLTANITSGAFYTLQIMKGLRLVSLNMNYCAADNFWLFINTTDPLGQLAWLAETLQQSENIGEKVHIIGHIHPSSCMETWSDNLYRIVNRYESTIAAQFFGHTHEDEFQIFYDLNDVRRAVSIAYVGGSVTTYVNNNPNYRIYTVDGAYTDASWQVLDHETYFLNLTDANLTLKPVWKKEYSAKEAFNLSSLYPQDWSDFIDRLLKDVESPMAKKLYKFFYKSSDAEPHCDKECRKRFICHFKQARPNDLIKC